ncbi:dTMP kinase [Salicola sp. Rm-C-2C1-2]|uniref:dTMP kinase n=1 Tax=Salicola sp. Rm-C-2C1-2 TaxID=3141321 RepID=UPI0032E3AB85
MKQGLFVTFEGTEGVGKSTAIASASDWLTEQGVAHRVTREPGGTPMAEEIRELLLRSREEVVDPTCELLLMFAARAQHLARLIRPSLEAGEWVLCDRFTDATYAYQAGGRGLDAVSVTQLESLVQGESLRPDAVLWLDAPVATGMARIAGRGGGPDRFEYERIRFFENVRQVYEARAADPTNHYRRIDAAGSVEEVAAGVRRTMGELHREWQYLR